MHINCDAANKLVKSLMADLEKVEANEKNNREYRYTYGQEPEIPEYDIHATQAKIDEINGKIFALKHAINRFNLETVVEGFDFTMDEALVRLKVLNKRRNVLNEMRSMPASSRTTSYRSVDAEIVKPNFDLDEAEKLYQNVNKELMLLQQAINRTNLTKTFEVDV